MGTDDLFKKRKAARKARKFEEKEPKANSFLIVTEGSKTEPLYLNGLKEKIVNSIGGNVEVIQIDIHGVGRSTNSLIDKTSEIINRSRNMYQYIWVVFDKDDFDDFDDAIARADRLGYNVAWSNQCFEYWAYLHFAYSDSALHRKDWESKLTEIYKQYGLGHGKYQKNEANIYDILNTYNGVDVAISNAKRRMNEFNRELDKPSRFDPGTTMHELVGHLKTYISD